ncbi:endonuclease III domain-containing protein [Xylocopilactobacillus apis]|uniref:Endonuclease III domain-containing protein n=1 Tax=Xylocopilactobacillus apis TaxID=2932183 RepID=A0AAU9D3Y1_9LACO|nr:deoxyribonuclease I [Xylocopilactobacillus apis]BDR56125.1 endonuclease III domain-containing protein [Xylocopilactobacillus apis]
MIELNWLYQTLSKHMGPSGWWPADSKQEIIIGAILVQNTTWKNADLSLQALKNKTNFKPEKILHLTDQELIETIKPSGFYRNKSRTIKLIYQWFNNRDWNFLLQNGETKSQLRKELLNITGIGNETADVYLVYIFDQVEFIPDSYTRRLFKKLGFSHTNRYEDLKCHITLPQEFTYHEAQDFHGLIDEFGKIYLKNDVIFNNSFLAKEIQLSKS